MLHKDLDRREIIRHIPTDVKESDYIERLDELETFLKEFKPEKMKTAEDLIPVIEANADNMVVVLRAVADIRKTDSDEWVAYTLEIPELKTGNFRARLYIDQYMIETSFAQNGFVFSGAPKSGFEMRLPDRCDNDSWRSDYIHQLSIYDANGIIARNMNINRTISGSDIPRMTNAYLASLNGIISYAQKQNEFVHKNDERAFWNKRSGGNSI